MSSNSDFTINEVTLKVFIDKFESVLPAEIRLNGGMSAVVVKELFLAMMAGKVHPVVYSRAIFRYISVHVRNGYKVADEMEKAPKVYVELTGVYSTPTEYERETGLTFIGQSSSVSAETTVFAAMKTPLIVFSTLDVMKSSSVYRKRYLAGGRRHPDVGTIAFKSYLFSKKTRQTGAGDLFKSFYPYLRDVIRNVFTINFVYSFGNSSIVMSPVGVVGYPYNTYMPIVNGDALSAHIKTFASDNGFFSRGFTCLYMISYGCVNYFVPSTLPEGSYLEGGRFCVTVAINLRSSGDQRKQLIAVGIYPLITIPVFHLHKRNDVVGLYHDEKADLSDSAIKDFTYSNVNGMKQIPSNVSVTVTYSGKILVLKMAKNERRDVRCHLPYFAPEKKTKIEAKVPQVTSGPSRVFCSDKVNYFYIGEDRLRGLDLEDWLYSRAVGASPSSHTFVRNAGYYHFFDEELLTFLFTIEKKSCLSGGNYFVGDLPWFFRNVANLGFGKGNLALIYITYVASCLLFKSVMSELRVRKNYFRRFFDRYLEVSSQGFDSYMDIHFLKFFGCFKLGDCVGGRTGAYNRDPALRPFTTSSSSRG